MVFITYELRKMFAYMDSNQIFSVKHIDNRKKVLNA
jgi:hypothetical protein